MGTGSRTTFGTASASPNGRSNSDTLPISQPPNEQIRRQRSRCHECRSHQMAMERQFRLLPVIAKKIAERKERADPQESAAVGERGESPVFEARSSGDNRRQMADAGNEIAGYQRPMAQMLEPFVDAAYPLLGQMEPGAVTMHDADPQGSADGVAQGDAAGAAAKRRGQGSGWIQAAARNQIPGKNEQCLVGNR